MQEDTTMSPGCKAYWERFYAVDGTLGEKQRRLRRRFDSNTSVLDHYEWFTTYEHYGDVLQSAIARHFTSTSQGRAARVLHVGCGNSDFADHFAVACGGDATASANQRRKGGARSAKQAPNKVVVLNVDICAELMSSLQSTFPNRLYCAGDCCDMCDSGDERLESAECWWRVPASGANCRIHRGSVDIVFDKGTMDAILSAFPGEENPNAQAYASQALQVLRVGGMFAMLSINSMDVLMPYFAGAVDAADDAKSFRLTSQDSIDVSGQFEECDNPQEAAERVETLGVRYTLYTMVVDCAAQ